MQTERFIASVQYGDLKGTSAADRADKNDAEAWLVANGHKQKDELLLGISMYAGENHGKHENPVLVEFLLAAPGDHDSVLAMLNASNGPVMVRRVKVSMSVTEFFGFFKRFSIAFSAHGMLGEREYTYLDY